MILIEEIHSRLVDDHENPWRVYERDRYIVNTVEEVEQAATLMVKMATNIGEESYVMEQIGERINDGGYEWNYPQWSSKAHILIGFIDVIKQEGDSDPKLSMLKDAFGIKSWWSKGEDEHPLADDVKEFVNPAFVGVKCEAFTSARDKWESALWYDTKEKWLDYYDKAIAIMESDAWKNIKMTYTPMKPEKSRWTSQILISPYTYGTHQGDMSKIEMRVIELGEGTTDSPFSLENDEREAYMQTDEYKEEEAKRREHEAEMRTFMGESGLTSYSVDSEGTWKMWR